MVNVDTTRCTNEGCWKKTALFGVESVWIYIHTYKDEFCDGFAAGSMVKVLSKWCTFDGCSKVASYDVEETQSPEMFTQ